MNKFYLTRYFIFFTVWTTGISAQKVSNHNFNLYIQSISSLMPNEFINNQWAFIEHDELYQAEQEYKKIVLPDTLFNNKKSNIFFAFASFHYFILDDKESAAKLTIMGERNLIDQAPPPIYYSHLLQSISQNNLTDQYTNSTVITVNNYQYTWQYLCQEIQLYCLPKTTYIRGYQLSDNSNTTQQISDSELERHLNNNRILIRDEIQYFNNLHLDFDNLFLRNATDQKINRNLFRLHIKRINNGAGLDINMTINIPDAYSATQREIVIRNIFNCYLSTLKIYKERHHLNFETIEPSFLIISSNRDIDIAATNVTLFEKNGLNNIDFKNYSIDTYYELPNNGYQIIMNAEDIFLSHSIDLTEKIKILESKQEWLNEQLKN